MKKILILLIFTICLTGCYDYQELNDRAIIVGLGIDYQNDEYVVNFEVLNSQKSGSEQSGGSPNKSYLIEGSDKSFSKAYQKALFSLNKDAYLAHLKVVVFSEDIAKNHLENIIDYLIRDPNTRNVFYPVISKEVTAKEILSSTSEDSPVVSTSIEGLIDYNNFKESISANINFEKFLKLLFNDYQDAYLNVISLSDEKKVKIEGLAVFNRYKMIEALNEKESATLQLINNESTNYYVSLPCENDQNKSLTISLYDSDDTKLEVDDKNIKINSKFKANIMDDECGYNFKDAKIYSDLEKKFANILEKDLNKTVNYFKLLKSDVLAIQNAYYLKNKKELKNWYELEVTSKVKVLLDKNGVIFGVDTK